MKRTFIPAFAVVLALVATAAVAQFPTKPIKMIVPLAAGGTTLRYEKRIAACEERQRRDTPWLAA